MHTWSITRRTISVQDLGTSTAYVPETLTVDAAYYVDKDGFHSFFNENSAVVFSLASDSIEMLQRDDAVLKESSRT